MAYLPLLDQLFPTALYVHLIRDGRDAATSFLSMPRGIVTESWAHPRSPAAFACQWRTEVEAARALGRRVGARYLEVRYEDLVRAPAAVDRADLRVRGAGLRPVHARLRGRGGRLGEAPSAATPRGPEARRPRLAVGAQPRRRRPRSKPWPEISSPARATRPSPIPLLRPVCARARSSRRTPAHRGVARGRAWHQALASLEAAPPAARVGAGAGAGWGANDRQAAVEPDDPPGERVLEEAAVGQRVDDERRERRRAAPARQPAPAASPGTGPDGGGEEREVEARARRGRARRRRSAAWCARRS